MVLLQELLGINSNAGQRILALLKAMLASATALVTVSTSADAVTKLPQSQAASQLRSVGVTWSSSGNRTDRHNSTCDEGTHWDGTYYTCGC